MTAACQPLCASLEIHQFIKVFNEDFNLYSWEDILRRSEFITLVQFTGAMYFG